MHQNSSRAGWLATGCLLAAALPVAAHAESADEWKFDATLYAWLPSIDIDARFPNGSSTISVSEGDVLDALEFTFMGAIDARKGRWGIGTDLIYLDLAGSKKQTRDFEIDGQPLPGGITARADIDVTGWLWTTAGFYRAVETFDRREGTPVAGPTGRPRGAGLDVRFQRPRARWRRAR